MYEGFIIPATIKEATQIKRILEGMSGCDIYVQRDYNSTKQQKLKNPPIKAQSSNCLFSDELISTVKILFPEHDTIIKKDLIKITLSEWKVLLDTIKENGMPVVEGQSKHLPIEIVQEPAAIIPEQINTIPRSKQIILNQTVRNLILEKGTNAAAYTAEEKELLRKYEGKGGLEKEGEEILDQFFTPDWLCEIMWKLAFYHGFTVNGKVLEPAMGNGRFIKFAPNQNLVVGFEKDLIGYTIAKVLYPEAYLVNQFFETAFLNPPRFTSKYNGTTSIAGYPFVKSKISWLGEFDLVIGNPPYGKHKNEFSSYFRNPDLPNMEQFFMFHSLRLLKPGGLLVFITSSNFLRNGTTYNDAKKRIFEISDLVDAYRMPNGVFDFTDVGTDIIVLRKKV